MAIDIIIYEDNNSLRMSLQAMLQLDNLFERVIVFSNATTVVDDINKLSPDVILMDIDMPDINGIEAVKKIRSQNFELPIIMFTVFEDNENIFNAICAGANGYLLKRNFDQIPAAIKDVLDGGAPMTSSVAKKILSFLPKNKLVQNIETVNLSARENEVLEYISKGFSYKMIAAELNIATETIRSHIKKIYKKLQVNSATEAVYKFNRQR